MRRLYRYFIIGLLLVGPLITIPKLHKMWVATGRLPGRTIYNAVVVDRWVSGTGFRRDYNFLWRFDDPHIEHVERVEQAEEEDWNKLTVGSAVDVALADGEFICTKSVYVSEGNFQFDYFLICIEVIAWILFIRYLLQRRRRQTTNMGVFQ